jgi:hypothetical protein
MGEKLEPIGSEGYKRIMQRLKREGKMLELIHDGLAREFRLPIEF